MVIVESPVYMDSGVKFTIRKSELKNVLVRVREKETGKLHKLLYAAGVENKELRAMMWVSNAYDINIKKLMVLKKYER